MTGFRWRTHRATLAGVMPLGGVLSVVVIVAGAWAAAEEADTLDAPTSTEWIDLSGVRGGAEDPSGAAERMTRTGSIHGRVVRVERPRRRVAERYPAAGRGSAREAPPVPPVVHLEGRLPGVRTGAADEVRMSQRDTTFVPGAAAVPVGTSVAFPNEDPFFHNVFSYSRAKRFDLGRFPQGESKSVVFDEPGYVKVFCEVHQWMRAGILVTDTPFHQVVGEDGTFRLDGVPEGRHTLVVTDFDRGATEVEVTVPAGGRVEVTVEVEG